MIHLLHPPARFCKECEGACCERCPGPYHPSDFPNKITTDYLWELLENGRAVVDWTKDTRKARPTYFLRPPSIYDNGHFISAHSRGSCVFLAEGGCILPFEERPLGCKNLKPSSDHVCKSTYCQPQAFRSWSKHKKVILEVMDIIDRRRKGDFSR